MLFFYWKSNLKDNTSGLFVAFSVHTSIGNLNIIIIHSYHLFPKFV